MEHTVVLVDSYGMQSSLASGKPLSCSTLNVRRPTIGFRLSDFFHLVSEARSGDVIRDVILSYDFPNSTNIVRRGMPSIHRPH